jgi:hypothetical protein
MAPDAAPCLSCRIPHSSSFSSARSSRAGEENNGYGINGLRNGRITYLNASSAGTAIDVVATRLHFRRQRLLVELVMRELGRGDDQRARS